MGGDPPLFDQMGTCPDVVNPVLVNLDVEHTQSLITLFWRDPPRDDPV